MLSDLLSSEGSSIEYKSSFLEEHMVTIVAFANGFNSIPRGYLVIGVNDNGDVIGLRQDPDDIQRRIADYCRQSCVPPLAPKMTVESSDEKKVVIIEVDRSPNRPHRYRGICYIRVGSTTRQATPEEEYRLRDETLFKSFDDYLVPDSSLDDLDREKVLEYYRETRSNDVVEADDRDFDVIVQSLGLTRKNDENIFNLSTASVLVFGKNPQAFFQLSSINAMRFRGNKRTDDILDRREIKGDLPKIISESVSFIQKFSLIGSSLRPTSIRRVDLTEYPLFAIREAVANAVTHRDYSDKGAQIDLYMYDDRIEIENPGSLGGGLTISDLQNSTGRRWLRNPQIAGFLLELGYIEKAGTGIPRMFQTLRGNGSPDPEFSISQSSFKVILRAHPDYAARRKFEEGTLAKDRGESDKARILFQEALEIREDYTDVLNSWADLERKTGQVREARVLYNRSRIIDDTNAETYINWAIMEERAGNISRAKELFEDGSKYAKPNAILLHSWGTLERNQKNFPQARELYRSALELSPYESMTWQSLGQLEHKTENYSEAETYLRKALEYARDRYRQAWIHSDLALTLDRLKRPADEIYSHFQTSLELNPQSAHTNYYYSQYLRKKGRGSESKTYLDRAVKLGWRLYRPRRRARR